MNDGPGSTVIHTKIHGNRSTGPREEDFKGVLPYMGVAAILVTFDQHHIILYHFHLLVPKSLHTQLFLEKQVLDLICK